MIAKQKALNLKAFEEVPPGFEPGIEVLQTFALPLGYGTIYYIICFPVREMTPRGFEPLLPP